MPLFRRRKSTPTTTPIEATEIKLPEPPASGISGARALPDHRGYVLGLISSLPPFGMKLLDAWGLALCEDIRCDFDLPANDVAGVDGFALRAEDASGAGVEARVTLRVKDVAPNLKMGAATPVSAGEVLPGGADAVLPFEGGMVEGDVLTVLGAVSAGDNVVPKAGHLKAGATIARTGQVVDARLSAVLAAAGFDKVLARPRPRVAVITVAENLAETGQPREGTDGFEVVSHLLAAAVRGDGASVWRISCHTGDADALREIVSDQLIRADLILVAGASAADREAVEQVMAGLGATDFCDLAMAPGPHQGFGLIGEDAVPMLLLPGDPVAAFVAYHALGRPAVRKLMGTEPYGHQAVMCYADETITSDQRVLQFALAKVSSREGARHATLLGEVGRPTLSDLAGANALAVLPPEKAVVHEGDTVMCWLLDRD